MGSDMYLDPPTLEEQRNWIGYEDIINLKTGEIKKKWKTKKQVLDGFRWVSDASKEELIKALSKNFLPKYDDKIRKQIFYNWEQVYAGVKELMEFFGESLEELQDEDMDDFKSLAKDVEKDLKSIIKDSNSFLGK